MNRPRVGDFEVAAGGFEELSAIGAFRRRYDGAASGAGVNGLQFDVRPLSLAVFLEYQSHVGALINRVVWLLVRLSVFGGIAKRFSTGCRDEVDLDFGGASKWAVASSSNTSASVNAE